MNAALSTQLPSVSRDLEHPPNDMERAPQWPSDEERDWVVVHAKPSSSRGEIARMKTSKSWPKSETAGDEGPDEDSAEDSGDPSRESSRSVRDCRDVEGDMAAMERVEKGVASEQG